MKYHLKILNYWLFFMLLFSTNYCFSQETILAKSFFVWYSPFGTNFARNQLDAAANEMIRKERRNSGYGAWS